MNVTLSRYEIKKAIQLYIEQTLGLEVVKIPTLYEADQQHATFAEAEIKEPKT